MRKIDGVTNFKELAEGEKHKIFSTIGKCLDKCERCPVSTLAGTTYVQIQERLVLCGGCRTYRRLRKLAVKLEDYDLTTRQKQLLNKGAELTGEEIEELFYSGVQKAQIARAMGFKDGNGSFNTVARDRGAILPKKYKHDFDTQQQYQTDYLGGKEYVRS